MTLIGLANSLKTVKFELDQPILKVGDQSPDMYIVSSGRVRLVHFQIAERDNKPSIYARKMV